MLNAISTVLPKPLLSHLRNFVHDCGTFTQPVHEFLVLLVAPAVDWFAMHPYLLSRKSPSSYRIQVLPRAVCMQCRCSALRAAFGDNVDLHMHASSTPPAELMNCSLISETSHSFASLISLYLNDSNLVCLVYSFVPHHCCIDRTSAALIPQVSLHDGAPARSRNAL
jgi:hypothetical protein